jgi:hypothetical protein
MLAIGGLLFGVTTLRGGALFPQRARLEVPAHRLEAMLEDFLADTARRPTPDEWRQMIEMQIDDEVLFRYALELGLHENTAAQARLAQIAAFVEANPHEAGSAEAADDADRAGARAAMALGLHEGDLVVRRILVDGARRLIRSVVLFQRPKPEAVRELYSATAEDYTRPARVRLSQIAVNAFKWPDTERRARRLLERIRAEKLSFDQALALADESPAPGAWSEPIPSRYGHHLVWVHERQDAYVPAFEAVREQVAQRLLEKLADEWLKLRLQELRAEYQIVGPEGRS